MAAERAKLKAYLAATAAVPKASFDSWSKPEQLAFLINVHNAVTVDLVLECLAESRIRSRIWGRFSSRRGKAFHSATGRNPLAGRYRTRHDPRRRPLSGTTHPLSPPTAPALAARHCARKPTAARNWRHNWRRPRACSSATAAAIVWRVTISRYRVFSNGIARILKRLGRFSTACRSSSAVTARRWASAIAMCRSSNPAQLTSTSSVTTGIRNKAP